MTMRGNTRGYEVHFSLRAMVLLELCTSLRSSLRRRQKGETCGTLVVKWQVLDSFSASSAVSQTYFSIKCYYMDY